MDELKALAKQFQSTLPAREATSVTTALSTPSINFNPRFPRGKRRYDASKVSTAILFQSTLPAREATSMDELKALAKQFQSTLPAREATSVTTALSTPSINFNPRFPRGKRRYDASKVSTAILFQSTLPAREATWLLKKKNGDRLISIHASREGSDLLPSGTCAESL